MKLFNNVSQSLQLGVLVANELHIFEQDLSNKFTRTVIIDVSACI
jgi:hypothetical protein